ncbi:carbamoyltransferase [Magnetospirillum sp. SS-4]|uniref:carbamoyltransferase family protein n=1 Tax=Magnetospirillum sp. SS-4 TaxID=2681465 RepID=UPI00137D7931|nr:carbamoyltransferase [Magnetospirillum sp. SS-4]CAA7616861.1 conserved hypothetical protein [Magnetospirillum sp. SS-4]
MNILGISCYYHDSSACLVKDGVVVAAADEERFSRKKHDSGFPSRALEWCLRQGGLTSKDLNGVAFYEKPLTKLERALITAKNYGDKAHEMAAWNLRHVMEESGCLDRAVKEATGYDRGILYLEHHLSHAASAFYPSPFQEAAILTVDGVGEWATTALYSGSGTSISKLREIRYPHSLGLLYSAMTAYLGFEVNEGEYKLMGLASYGQPKYQDLFNHLLTLHDDGSFRLDQDFFCYTSSRDRMFSDALPNLFGMEPQHPGAPSTQKHMDVAASLQAVVERAMVNLARAAKEATGASNLCLAGGVAHNVVANTAIRDSGLFEQIFIQPAAGDSGGSLGAALYGYYHLSGAPRLIAPPETCFGPAYDDTEIQAALDSMNQDYECFDDPDSLCRRVAELIAHDFIIGWFQGRMEFGPRALGNRSILANPRNAAMKETVNARVKFREEFRPFAPAVLEERATEYFALNGDSPFMQFAPQVHPDKRTVIPATTHVDNTARVQTVSAERYPLFHRLIVEIGKISGVPVVLNTSFNVKGEPIVCSPADAIRCFRNSDIDYLAIGSFLVMR